MTYTDEDVERVAAIIARALGDNLELAFLSKSSWTHARGIAVDGSVRDINAPLRCDYLNAARAALSAIPRQTVPEGWQLVPKDLSDQQISSAMKAFDKTTAGYLWVKLKAAIEAANASATPPTQEGK